MTRGVACLFVLISLGIPRFASAQPREPGAHSVPVSPQLSDGDASAASVRWYGWQTLASDGASVLVLVAAVESHDSSLLAPLSVVGYAIGAPGVHLYNHRPWKALGSLALRIGLPATGLAMGMSSAKCPPPTGDYGNCGEYDAIVGLGAGLLAASLIDASVLAWKREGPAETESATQLGLVPILSPDGKRGELRLVGTF